MQNSLFIEKQSFSGPALARPTSDLTPTARLSQRLYTERTVWHNFILKTSLFLTAMSIDTNEISFRNFPYTIMNLSSNPPIKVPHSLQMLRGRFTPKFPHFLYVCTCQRQPKMADSVCSSYLSFTGRWEDMKGRWLFLLLLTSREDKNDKSSSERSFQ